MKKHGFWTFAINWHFILGVGIQCRILCRNTSLHTDVCTGKSESPSDNGSKCCGSALRNFSTLKLQKTLGKRNYRAVFFSLLSFQEKIWNKVLRWKSQVTFLWRKEEGLPWTKLYELWTRAIYFQKSKSRSFIPKYQKHFFFFFFCYC